MTGGGEEGEGEGEREEKGEGGEEVFSTVG